MAGQRDADRERRGADPPRSQLAAGRSLDDPRVVRVRCRRRRLVADEVRHPLPRLAPVQPVEHRARRRLPLARQHAGRATGLLVVTAGRADDRGVRRHPGRWRADHAPPRSPGSGDDLLGRARRRRRAGGPVRALHGRPVGIRAGVRVRLLASDRHLARGVDLPVLHAHRPEDGAARPGRPDAVRARPGDRGHGPDRTADERVRDQGCAARQPRDRVRRPPAPRAPGAGGGLGRRRPNAVRTAPRGKGAGGRRSPVPAR